MRGLHPSHRWADSQRPHAPRPEGERSTKPREVPSIERNDCASPIERACPESVRIIRENGGRS